MNHDRPIPQPPPDAPETRWEDGLQHGIDATFGREIREKRMYVVTARRMKALLHAERVAQELRYQIAGVPAAQMDLGQACEHLFRYMRLSGKRCYERPKTVKTWRRMPFGPK